MGMIPNLVFCLFVVVVNKVPLSRGILVLGGSKLQGKDIPAVAFEDGHPSGTVR